MKTLFYCNLVPNKTGAFERVLTELGRVHTQHGDHLILALAGEPIPDVAEWFRRAGVEWHVIHAWTAPDGRVQPWHFVCPALRLIREVRPDVAVVHFGNELPSLAVSLLAPLYGIRGLKWVWQQDQQMALPGRLTRWISRVRLLGFRFNRFVAVYEGGRRSLVGRAIPKERVTVVYNGTVDPEPVQNRARARALLRCDDRTLVLISAGSMISRKRQQFLISAFSRTVGQPNLPSMRLVLVGDGPERARLEQQVAEQGLQDDVMFLGARNDVAMLMCGADVFVHAATGEGCAYVLAEAMAAGLPVVVTDAGAAQEQVVQGKNGFILPRDDENGFAERLMELARDEASRDRMGSASRERWQRLFRVKEQARAYWAIYRAKGKDNVTIAHVRRIP